GAARGDGGGSGHRRGHHAHARAPLLRGRDAESRRVSRHVPAARIPARPIRARGRDGAADGGRGDGGSRPSRTWRPDRGPDRGDRRQRRDRAPGGLPARRRRTRDPDLHRGAPAVHPLAARCPLAREHAVRGLSPAGVAGVYSWWNRAGLRLRLVVRGIRTAPGSPADDLPGHLLRNGPFPAPVFEGDGIELELGLNTTGASRGPAWIDGYVGGKKLTFGTGLVPAKG